MRRRVHEYLLSVGSNIEPGRWIPAALGLLRRRLDVVAVSPLFDVAAVGGGEQPPFVNLAVRVRTDLPPRALREACRSIEILCERVRTGDPFEPRTLDLDVVHGAHAWDGEHGLPDPDLLGECYVLVPCAAIWPDAQHPGEGRPLAALAEERCPGWDAEHRRAEEA